MGEFLTWGVIGILATLAVGGVLVAYWFDPSRQPRVEEKRRKRRAARNQAWVRKRVAQNGVMARSIDDEAQVIAKFLIQIEDPWKHLTP